MSARAKGPADYGMTDDPTGSENEPDDERPEWTDWKNVRDTERRR